MKRKIIWMMVSGLMALSLVMAACSPAAPVETEVEGEKKVISGGEEEKEEKEEEEKKEEVAEEEVVEDMGPKYGGSLRLLQNGDITGWDDVITRGPTPGAVYRITNEAIWQGDWTKGPAGTDETDWRSQYDIFDHKAGHIAESWDWSVDAENDVGTLVYQIRPGVHYALNPDSEASRLVGGREVTADDVVFSLLQHTTESTAYVYRANPELRVAEITKTGPMEVTVKLPIAALISAISRFGNYGRAVPPEVVEKYGDLASWKNSVGTGPFYLKDYVPGSVATLVKNPAYWGTDPIGPGKGNQVPYLDGFQYLIVPDISTRQAALRTGQVDQMLGLSWEDAALMRQMTPELLEVEVDGGGMGVLYMRTDKAPFDDVRVRRAMMMATDFEAIRQGFNGGFGQILTWPFSYVKEYADLYLGLDDPVIPESVKELYVYNPEKSRQLLTEAGYPEGFKTSMLITAGDVDEYSIIKDMWSKVGIDMELDVRDSGPINSIRRSRTHEALTTGGQGPISIFYLAVSMTGEGVANLSMISDPLVDEAVDRVRIAAISDLSEAMAIMKTEVLPHVLDQAFTIPGPKGVTYAFWWPWIKNYSGENTIGYFVGDFWATWAWLDQNLKKEMGY